VQLSTPGPTNEHPISEGDPLIVWVGSG